MSVKKEILRRVTVVYLSFLLIGLVIIGRIFYLQIFEKQKWMDQANSYSLKTMNIEADRGSIYAADGRLLASSVPYYEIHFDARCENLTDRIFQKNIDSLSLCLSRLFNDKSPAAYRQGLQNARHHGNRYYLVKSGVNYIQLKKLKKFPLFRLGRFKGGLVYMQENRRIRPQKDLAARLIGYKSKDENGNLVGIEGAYNDYLAGTQGVRLMQRLNGDVWMPMNERNEIEPRDGEDIVTTLDVNLQDVAQNALMHQLITQEADHGTVVVMEVQTGEVKAMVNLGKDSQGYYREIQNYAIGESIEPGSTFKLPSLIAALEDDVVDLDDTIDTGNGTFKYYDKIIRDDRHGDVQRRLSVEEVFEYSSNVGMAKIITGAYKEKPSQFIDRLYAMHLNEKLGLDIKGEGKPEIGYPGDKYWSGISLAMIAHGYEVRITPLQTLTFYNAIANNGKMVKPRFVKEITYHGRVVKRFEPEVIQSSVCSRSTLRKVRKILEGVVEKGTATNLKNPQIKIAGKTGTNQLFNSKYGSYKSSGMVSYQASFVGYFPADEPRYSCIVVVNSPSRNVYYGNMVAGPVFLEIARKVYATATDLHPLVAEIEGLSPELPYSKTGNRDELKQVLRQMDIPMANRRIDAEWVSTEKQDEAVALNMRKIVTGLVPNVVSMGAKDAVYLLENAGLRVKVIGRGSVRNQSIDPGTPARKGDQIILEMSYI